MRFMMLMIPKGYESAEPGTMPDADAVAAMMKYNESLQKAGVSPETALDVINSSSGRSNTSMNLFPERVVTRAFPRTFRLALMDKDVRIAADFAREYGVASPLLQLASELLREARRELGEEADHVETVQVLEEWAGVQLEKKA